MKARSADVESVWEAVHLECGYSVGHQVHVPEWDRFRWRCPTCDARGVSWTPPAAPCAACGSALDARREEAVLDLEVRSAEHPRLLLDVTVRHSVPGDAPRLASGHAHATERGGMSRLYPWKRNGGLPEGAPHSLIFFFALPIPSTGANLLCSPRAPRTHLVGVAGLVVAERCARLDDELGINHVRRAVGEEFAVLASQSP